MHDTRMPGGVGMEYASLPQTKTNLDYMQWSRGRCTRRRAARTSSMDSSRSARFMPSRLICFSAYTRPSAANPPPALSGDHYHAASPVYCRKRGHISSLECVGLRGEGWPEAFSGWSTPA
jgi:hypothetical protein